MSFKNVQPQHLTFRVTNLPYWLLIVVKYVLINSFYIKSFTYKSESLVQFGGYGFHNIFISQLIHASNCELNRFCR